MRTTLISYFILTYILLNTTIQYCADKSKRPQPRTIIEQKNSNPKNDAIQRLLDLHPSIDLPVKQNYQPQVSSLLICLPSTKHPFEIIEIFVPNKDATKFFIKTENSSEQSEYYLKAFDLYMLDEIFANNPGCTTLFVDLNNQSSYDNHNINKIFAVNRQIIPYKPIGQFRSKKTLQQESDLQSSLSSFANALAASLPAYTSKPLIISTKTINFSPKNNDAHNKTEKENEIVVVDQTIYLKQYGTCARMIPLSEYEQRDLDVIMNLYWYQARGNQIPQDSCTFSITSIAEEIYHIFYITHNNKTVCLSCPIQTISSTTNNHPEQNSYLSIDLNNIAHLHTKKDTRQPLYCTKEQILQLKKATSCFFITSSEEKTYHITDIHYPTGEQRALTDSAKDQDVHTKNDTFTIKLQPFLPQDASEITELFVADPHQQENIYMKVKTDYEEIQDCPYYLSQSYMNAIAEIFFKDNNLQRISILISNVSNPNSNTSKNSCFILSKTVFEKAKTSDFIKTKNDKEVERIVNDFKNIQPSRPKIFTNAPKNQAIIPKATEPIEPKPSEKTDTLPEITNISYLSAPFLIGTILTFAGILAYLLLHYKKTTLQDITT